jgi:MSHA biogenesis protein MshK
VFPRSRFGCRAALVAGCLLLGGLASSTAQELADPTRRPDVREAEPAAAPSVGPSLQLIILSPGRRLAVINGKTMRIGDRVGEARIVAIDVDSVRLRSGDGLTVMKLLPNAEKAPSTLKFLRRRNLQRKAGDES